MGPGERSWRSWPETRYRQGLLQGRLQERLDTMGPEARQEIMAAAVTQEALDTTGIEGEAVFHSVARRVSRKENQHGPGEGRRLPEHHEDGLVAMLLDATARYREELTEERLLGWHSWLFPNSIHRDQPVRAGEWRTGPTRVISGLLARERVLPGPEPEPEPEPEQVPGEMRDFLEWFNSPPGDRRRPPGRDRPTVVLHRAPVRGRQRPLRTGHHRHGPGPVPKQPNAALQHVPPDTPGEEHAYCRDLEKATLETTGGYDTTAWLSRFARCFGQGIDDALETLPAAQHNTALMEQTGQPILNHRQL